MHQRSLFRPRAAVSVASQAIDTRSLTVRLASLILAIALLAAFFPSFASASDSENIRLAKAVSNAYAEVVEKVGPAVVGIETEKIIKNDFSSSDDMGMDVFERFFGMPPGFGPSPRQRQMPQNDEPRRVPALGSGVIIDEQGHILTNNHVVADADSIKVELANEKGKTYKAEIVGRDPNSDIAIIKLIDPPANIPVARLGDSDLMKPGNTVIAIGSPLGFKQSVTTGVVSAVSRTLGEFSYERFIQTDAAINQGNSGGPLLNLDGEVIGINTIISTTGRSSGSIGIGFAIPTSLAKPVITQLIEKGAVTRGYVGIVMNPDDPDISMELGHDGTGVVVVDVAPNGPADKAGIQPRDLIISLNGIAIRDNDHLRYMVAETEPGTVMPVVVLRNGARVNLDITVEAQPEDMFSRARVGGGKSGPGMSERGDMDQSKELGVTVQNLDDAIRQRYNISGNVESGVVVTKVDPDSDAADKGVRVGAVIQEVDKREITDVASFRSVMNDVKGRDKVLVSVRFGEVARWVMIRLEK